jgi:hypothetical protein
VNITLIIAGIIVVKFAVAGIAVIAKTQAQRKPRAEGKPKARSFFYELFIFIGIENDTGLMPILFGNRFDFVAFSKKVKQKCNF